MSKFASFGVVVLLFLLLSLTVMFGFFVFTPDIKAYRALNIELSEKQKRLSEAEKIFSEKYQRVQDLQDRERQIDRALQKHFDEAAFEAYLSRYFKTYSLRSIISEHEGEWQTDTIAVQVIIDSPAEYYKFIDALNQFEWVAEVEGTQMFKGTASGIKTSFTLKVYTRRS